MSTPEIPQSDPRRRRSWVDILISFVERLPGPPWLFYLLVSLVFGVLSVALRWLDGSAPVGTANPVTTAFATGSVYPLAVVHYLTRTARRSLADFRPALGALESKYDELERNFTRTPLATSIAAVVLGVVAQRIGSSGGGWGVTAQTAPYTVVFTAVAQITLNIFFALFVLRAIGQLRMIVRIHRQATAIRLYDTEPHNAFARFTLATAVSITVPYAILEVFVGLLNAASVFEVVLLVFAVILSGVLFILPLNGMHRRLVTEKSRQLSESDRAFETTAGMLHRDIETGSLDQVDGLNKAMASLVLESDRLKKISTWPWSADTLRGFVSSIGLPILLWLVTTVLGRVFSIGS